MQLLRLSSTGSKFPKFLMSSKHKSVPPQSLHHSSALWHITPLYFFWLKHNMLSTKKHIKVQSFRLLSALITQLSLNSLCHFWNCKIRFYSGFASLFSVMKDNSSPLPLKRNFQTFEWLGENSPKFSCHIWNHKLVFL